MHTRCPESTFRGFIVYNVPIIISVWVSKQISYDQEIL